MAKGKWVEETGSASDGIESALGMLGELRDEITEWRDNMSAANMEHLPKFEAVSEAADAFDNLDLDAGDEVAKAIRDAVNGKPFRAGCPPHVPGTKCGRCKWDGGAREAYRLTLPEPPVLVPPSELRPEHVGHTYWKVVWGSYRGRDQAVGFYSDATTPAIPPAILIRIEQAQRGLLGVHEVDVNQATGRRQLEADFPPACKLPRELPDEPEIEPVPGLAERVAHVTWQRLKKTKPSRADRRSDALSMLRTSIESVREGTTDLEGLTESQEDVVQAIAAALDDLDTVCDEVEDVEFPGMY